MLDFEAAPHWLHCMFSIVFYVLCSSLCLWQILWSYQNKVLQLPCGITVKEHNRTTTLVIILENNRRIMNNSYGLHYISRRTNTRSECQGRKITTLGKFDKTSKQSTRKKTLSQCQLFKLKLCDYNLFHVDFNKNKSYWRLIYSLSSVQSVESWSKVSFIGV